MLSRPGRVARPSSIPAPKPGYPGDYVGVLDIRYAPKPDGQPDPGEVVWGWIPYEDDHSRGKDRPALVVGRDGPWLLVLMLTSKDMDLSDGDDNRHEVWVDIGSGPWDRERRPSEVRVDRIIRLAEHAVRREGAVLDPQRFDQIASALRVRGHS
ncbi:MAG: type II toxin-antitoxin system PemK/MazF family toxin [Actinomycetota bacterium]|nr:type II toxin-antitoxin system PemK/MazF family toxin [Actinomycetota bacterium]